MVNTKIPMTRPGTPRPAPRSTITLKFKLPRPRRPQLPKGLAVRLDAVQQRLPFLRDLRVRIGAGLVAVLVVVAELIVVLQPYLVPHTYALGTAGSLLAPISQPMADKLKYDPQKQSFAFNDNYSANATGIATAGGGQIKAAAYEDASKGVTVTDPANKVDFSLKPHFKLAAGRQDGNRIVYPLADGSGWTVYSMHSVGVKEDVLLSHAERDTMTLDYTLGLGDGFAAHLQKDGSIGVFGNKLFSGNVSTGSDKDAELLQKARRNAPKDSLLFSIPAPTVAETGKHKSAVKVAYTLKGDNLKVNVSGLKAASFPLTIDPSIYVSTAQQFMNGNNETNIDFDVADQLIRKGATTGARFNSWGNNTDLPASQWGSSYVAAGGYIYNIGGTTFNGQLFTSQGSASFVVPAGTTSLTVKMWGGGAGGGGGGTLGGGGAGGAGGYVTAVLTVTPGETLNVYVGGGGGGGISSASGGGAGGGGGGYTSLYRGSTPLIVAAGGGAGGGGGSRTGTTGGAGGAGGGTTGVTGTAANNSGGGGGGSQSAGGAGGTGGSSNGLAGSSLTGGAGADGSPSAGPTGGGAVGGLISGGGGGAGNSRSGGGGGGSGYFGGGGSSCASNQNSGSNGAGGGGGGSSYTVSGATAVTNSAGSGQTPANSADSFRNGAGQGGNGGALNGSGNGGANGVVVVSYGGGTTAVTQAVNWSQFNTTTGVIQSPDPGSGTCSGWCSTSAYNLPAARANFSLIAYNGYLYAIGGCTANPCATSTLQTTVYITKLGANGEPRRWHPSDPNTANWVYWYSDTALSSTRALTAAVAYNNRMYLIGGLSGTTTLAPVSTVQVANINPTGTLGSFSSSTALPVALQGHSAQIYNDRIYVLGGASTFGGTTLNSVYYNKINSDGTLNSWIQTSSFSGGRVANGGNLTTITGGYIYISAGCSTVNASNYCSATASDTQVASINADGSLDVWYSVGGVSNQRSSAGLVSWRGYIYQLGGCFSQDTTSGSCDTAMLAGILYGAINQDGDASTVGTSSPNASGSCTGATPTGCDLPGTANIGDVLAQTVISNGYLYVIGGCTSNTCATESPNTAYVAISSSGTMTKPSTCPSGAYQGGDWCVDTVHTLSSRGISGAGTTVFGNRIYLTGGFDGVSLSGNIVYTTVNTDGSISGWTTQALTTVGATSVAYPYTYARSNPSSAGTNPGNFYIMGGCTGVNNAACSGYTDAVYKCSIGTTGAIAGCSTSGQLQIGTVSGATGVGIGAMGGAVYAGYIYLVGGEAPGQASLNTVRYAKFDNNNNIVAASGSAWTESSNTLTNGRQRAAVFAYNGYLYVVGGYNNSTSTTLSDIQFIKINTSDGSLGSTTASFVTSSVTILARWGLSVPVSNSYAFVIGGCTAGASPGSCTARTDSIQTFQIYNNDSGAPASFTTSAATYGTDSNRIGAGSTILNGYLYVAGGCTSTTDCTAASSNVSYSQINASGTLGSWSSTTAALPAARAWGQLLASGGSLYFIGGQSSTATDVRAEVYYATPSSGNVSSWSTASNGLPGARSKFGATVWNNRLYVVGGLNATPAPTTTVYISPQLTSGGDISSAWSTSTNAFNVARSGLTAVAYGNNLYAIGGYDGANYLSDSQYTQINTSTGDVGSWSYAAGLPRPMSQGSGFAYNGYLYLVGGRTADTVCSPVVMVAPISANTPIASGNRPTGLGSWYESNAKYTGSRYGATAAYYDGKAFVTGGGCGSTLTYGSPVSQQTTILSQPQVAKYSIAFDTDSDVYPNKWLLNGVDNSIGAKWQLKYRSMTNPAATVQCAASGAMTTWGQETNFGDVTLGLPGVYIPKDASGTNTNCARFFYFNITVDSSQAFGYPDDVSRGPTITNLTLQFTADPSKRLMHGRTFTGGLQQPDDTPYYSQ